MTATDHPSVAMQAPMFEFTAEHDALREVLLKFLASTSTLEPHKRWRRLLTEVGLGDILCAPDGGESRASAIEHAIAAEALGAVLLGGQLMSTAAIGVLSSMDDVWSAVTEQVRAGQRAVSAAVSLTCAGTSGVEFSEATGQYVASEFVEPTWDFIAGAFVVVDGSLDGEPAITLFDGAAGGFSGLSGFDPSRPLGRLQCRGATPLAVTSGAAAADALTTIRHRLDLIVSAELLGLSQWVLDATVQYVGQRVQFGRTIGSFQAVKHRLADLLAQVELTRSAVYAAAWQIEDQPSAIQTDVDLAVAAVLARETALDTTRAAVQLHGGIAITAEHWAHRYLRRAHSMVALTGSAGSHRRRLAALFDIAEGCDV